MWQDIKIGATLKNPKYFEEVSLTEAFNNKQYEIINAYIEFKDIKYADEIKEFKNNRYLDYNFDLIELLMNYGIYVARTEGREETLIDSQYQSNVLKILHKRIK
jgi:malate synthase